MIARRPGAEVRTPSKARSFINISEDNVQKFDPFRYSQSVSSKDSARFHHYQSRDVEQKKVLRDNNGFASDSIFFDSNNVPSDEDPFSRFVASPPTSDPLNPPRSKNDIFDMPLAPKMPYLRSKSRNAIFDVPPSSGPSVKPPPRLTLDGGKGKLTSPSRDEQRSSELADGASPAPSSSSTTTPTPPKNLTFFDSKPATPQHLNVTRLKPPLNTQPSQMDTLRNLSPSHFSSPPLSQLLPQTPPDAHLIPQQDINFVLLPTRKNLLGIGRHSQVYKASYTISQQPTPKICAVKRLNANKDSQALGLNEAYVLKRLNKLGGQHENIITLIDIKDEASIDSRSPLMNKSSPGRNMSESVRDEQHLTGDATMSPVSPQSAPYQALPMSPVPSEPGSPLDADYMPRLVLLLEYCANGSLWDWVQENKSKVGLRLWMKWARQLSSAIERVHAVGLVHHDVKPHNILLTEMLDVKLSDFGTAMFANTTVLDDGHGKGTPEYSPPELLATPPHPYSHPVDIFSLGVTLYVVGITGEPYRMVRSGVELHLWVRKGGFWEWEERLRQIMAPSRRSRNQNWPLSATSVTTSPYDDAVRFLNGDLVPLKILELLKRMVAPDPSERPNAVEVSATLRELDDGDEGCHLPWSGFDREKRGDQTLYGEAR